MAYRFAHRVLVNSAAIGDLLVREEGVSRDRVVVIPNFVEEEAFAPLSVERRATIRSRLGLAADDMAVGIVANLYPVKNHAMLLRAVSHLATEWRRVRFVLVGDGAEREALQRMARDLGIAGQVLMPGRLANEPGFAGAFDIAVLTSREEGFPNWIVEAMAAGRPVVATDVGGVPDAVQHEQTGLLVPPDDDRAMAESLRRLLGDETLRVRFGRAGSERARSLYHVNVVMRALEALYTELAARS
jgi:glycosyltransferase involved in cell wall biosynthesis